MATSSTRFASTIAGSRSATRLVLEEWIPESNDIGRYTGRKARVVVTYITHAGAWGLPANLCVMSILMLGSDGLVGAIHG